MSASHAHRRTTTPASQATRDGAPAWTYTLDDEPAAVGAQGAVYFGTRSDGLAVAVKVAGEDVHDQDALRHEAHMMHTLAEAGVEGVVPCIDVLDRDGRPGLVMPRYPTHLLPWLYWIFLFILLVDRAGRDEKRCAAKYGPAWATYREHVPWRILPGVY